MRLTKIYPNGTVTIEALRFGVNQEALDTAIRNSEPIKAAVERLSDYEDAEKNGTLIKLPCKVGDTVYRLYSNFLNNKVAILPQTIVQIRAGINIRGDSKIGVVVDYDEHYTLDEFNETFFLTREEAEKALKERESE